MCVYVCVLPLCLRLKGWVQGGRITDAQSEFCAQSVALCLKCFPGCYSMAWKCIFIWSFAAQLHHGWSQLWKIVTKQGTQYIHLLTLFWFRVLTILKKRVIWVDIPGQVGFEYWSFQANGEFEMSRWLAASVDTRFVHNSNMCDVHGPALLCTLPSQTQHSQCQNVVLVFLNIHYSIQFNSIQFYLYSAITIQLSLGALQSPEPETPLVQAQWQQGQEKTPC